jgi:hypothetical protein
MGIQQIVLVKSIHISRRHEIEHDEAESTTIQERSVPPLDPIAAPDHPDRV